MARAIENLKEGALEVAPLQDYLRRSTPAEPAAPGAEAPLPPWGTVPALLGSGTNTVSARMGFPWLRRPARISSPVRSGPSEGGGVFWRHCRLLAREPVFDGEYLKAGKLSERRIEHASTGSLFFHRGRGLGKCDEQTHG